MRRTQLYLDDDLWQALHIQARQSGTSVSELARQAIRERYGRSAAGRAEALRSWVGVWKNRTDLRDVDSYVRRLRKGKRLRRLTS